MTAAMRAIPGQARTTGAPGTTDATGTAGNAARVTS